MSEPETVEYSPTCTMNIEIPSEAKKKPDFAVRDLEVDSIVEITVKGRVCSINHDQYSQTCKLDITDIKVSGAEPKDSLSAAVRRVQRGILGNAVDGRDRHAGLGRSTLIMDDME